MKFLNTIIATFLLVSNLVIFSKSTNIKLYERTYVDYPFCPEYYKYCTVIKLNLDNLLNSEYLEIDLGITDVKIQRTKTYHIDGTYLSEFKVRERSLIMYI